MAASNQGRSAEEILADWRAVRTEDLTAGDTDAPDWAERCAAVATRTADLIEEASDLDPMPRQIAMFAVGLAAWQLREHAAYMTNAAAAAGKGT